MGDKQNLKFKLIDVGDREGNLLFTARINIENIDVSKIVSIDGVEIKYTEQNSKFFTP